jgi:hypothetical protein
VKAMMEKGSDITLKNKAGESVHSWLEMSKKKNVKQLKKNNFDYLFFRQETTRDNENFSFVIEVRRNGEASAIITCDKDSSQHFSHYSKKANYFVLYICILSVCANYIRKYAKFGIHSEIVETRKCLEKISKMFIPQKESNDDHSKEKSLNDLKKIKLTSLEKKDEICSVMCICFSRCRSFGFKRYLEKALVERSFKMIKFMVFIGCRLESKNKEDMLPVQELIKHLFLNTDPSLEERDHTKISIPNEELNDLLWFALQKSNSFFPESKKEKDVILEVVKERCRKEKLPGVNFINILRSIFLYKSTLRSFSLITIWLCNFLAKGYVQKIYP